MLRDHNADVARDERWALADVRREEREEQQEAERERQRKRTRLIDALAAGAEAYSSSRSHTPAAEAEMPHRAPGHRATSAPDGCSSDYECGVGFVCAKDSMAFRGVCARAVNEYGVPQMHTPDPASVGPGTGTCSFDTDCAPGFRCTKTSGGLRGNCMK
jgi:hypothetical protein